MQNMTAEITSNTNNTLDHWFQQKHWRIPSPDFHGLKM